MLCQRAGGSCVKSSAATSQATLCARQRCGSSSTRAAISLLARDHVNVITARDYLSGVVLQEMKARCPVSPVQPVYATKGRTVPGGCRLAGDFPLSSAGFLRSLCRRVREPDGGYVIGPTANYELYVNNGTQPHVITSHGPGP